MTTTTDHQADPAVHEWRMTPVRALAIQGFACVVAIGAIPCIGWLASTRKPESFLTFEPGVPSAMYEALGFAGVMGVVLGITAVLLVAHEWCHGLAFRWAGARPRYGAKLAAGCMPVFYATAPGQWLPRSKYMLTGLAPTVCVNAAAALLMLPDTPLRHLMVLPLAVHLGGCAGDWAIALALARLPKDALTEDAQEGFRYRLPSSDGAGQ